MFLKILAILATTIAVIFSTLIPIGLWAGPNHNSPPSQSPAPKTPKTASSSAPPAPAASPMTPHHPSLSAPELAQLARPYTEWAPKPFSELPGPALVPGIPGSGVSPPVSVAYVSTANAVLYVLLPMERRHRSRIYALNKLAIFFRHG
ncbi:hypothetical protein GMDG_02964 [Pseudogymnoascus destructans 20631-21]|uniref:Uncharacterized protein n=1 Tax=Pseudogymnoascus destructans (strain ATCC MYA-4855 / 20631-21) TaxID=658429 RepID=L8G4W4_PSED2|nr:hypothetical protein GMDG_02964 [Pseudogymnoascus destructans 20631-21]